MGCGHTFCKECLKFSFVENIKNRICSISCVAEGCDYLLSSEVILNLVEDEKYKSLYLRLLTQSYVDNNEKTVWCPGTDCDLAIRSVSFEGDYNVKCSKGHRSCFKCQKPPHDPLDCRILKKWLQKCNDSSETDNWIVANTWECPRCRVAVQKDGGCNHIHCLKCGWHWYWACFEEWGEHSCQPKERASVKDSRMALERYIKYYDLYANHMNSLKLESKIKIESIFKRFEQPIEVEIETGAKSEFNNKSLENVEEKTKVTNGRANFKIRCLLERANEILKESRSMLMYSYVFAFYLSPGNMATCFEWTQTYLQSNVERLSEFLEMSTNCPIPKNASK